MIDTFIGKTLADKYRIDSVMRETELGKVYHATHLLMEKPVAVKILSPALAVDENIVKRFSAEARKVSDISNPNILNVKDFGADANGAVYIVYEDATGETLKNAIGRDGMFAPERAVNITKQIAAGLSAAHIKGLIHGNLNSENILLTADDSVKILDLGTFGSGATADDEISAPKIEYVSPEQCVDTSNADARSDIYSLGVILYEMLAGEVPFKAANASEIMMKHAQEPPPPLSAFRQDLPAGIEPVVLQTLAKNPEMRHQNAAELIDDLNRVSRGLVVSESPVVAPHQPISNNIWKTAFVVLAGILLLSAAMIWATSVKQTNPTTMQTDANAQPVQPINPPTGMNEQGLATIVPITQDSMSNSNAMTVPTTLEGSDGNPYWQSGRVPPGAPVPQSVQPPGQFVDPNNPNSPFMRDESGNYFIMVPQPTTSNSNVNTKPATTKTPKGNAANTTVQPSPVPTETPKPQTSPTPEVKTPPAKTPAPTPKPTEKPKTTPSSTKTTQSGKTQDG
jgi:eukaryotic-like serine/threonine-protein kinase